jgi:hypothetical protein
MKYLSGASAGNLGPRSLDFYVKAENPTARICNQEPFPASDMLPHRSFLRGTGDNYAASPIQC